MFEVAPQIREFCCWLRVFPRLNCTSTGSTKSTLRKSPYRSSPHLLPKLHSSKGFGLEGLVGPRQTHNSTVQAASSLLRAPYSAGRSRPCSRRPLSFTASGIKRGLHASARQQSRVREPETRNAPSCLGLISVELTLHGLHLLQLGAVRLLSPATLDL